MYEASPELRRGVLAMAVACGLAFAPGWALAQPQAADAVSDDAHAWQLPAAPLAQTLNLIAARSGRTISVDPALLAGRSAPAIEGRLPADAAARRALAGSGLGLVVTPSGAWTVVAAPGTADADGDVIVTGALSVEGAGRQAADLDPDATYRSAGSVAYIDAQHIQRHRGTNIGDVVAGIPGVLSGENRNSGGLDLNIRGMQGMNRVPVVVDGAQQSSVVYRGYSGVASRNYLDPDLLAEMVIEKGPSTRPEAVGATGGVMVARTVSADDILAPGETFGVRLRGELRGNTTSPPAAGTKGGLQTDAMMPLANGAGTSQGWVRGCEANPAFPTFCDRYPVGVAIPDAAYAQEAPPGDRPGTLEPTDGGGSIVVARRWDQFDLVGAYARRRAGNYFAGSNGPSAGIVEVINPYRTNGGTVYYETLALSGDTRFRSGEQVINSGYDNTSYLLKGTGRWGDGQSLEVGFNRFDSDYGDMMPSEIVRGEGFKQGMASNVVVDTWTARYRLNPADTPWLDLRVNVWNKDITLHRNMYYGLIEWMAGLIGSGDFNLVPAAAEYSKRTGVDVDNSSRFDGGWGTLQLRYGASMTKENLTTDPVAGLPENTWSLDPTSDRHDGKRDEQSAFVSAQWEPLDWLQVDAGWRYTRSNSHDRNLTRAQIGVDANRRPIYTDWMHYTQRNSDSAPVFALTFKPMDGVQLYLRHAEATRAPGLFESTSGFSTTPNPLLSIRPERMHNREIGLNIEHADLFGDDVLRLHLAYFDNRVDDYIYRAVGGSANLEYARFKGAELTAEYDRGRVYGATGLMHYRKLDYCEYTPDTPAASFVKCYENGVGFADTQIPPKQTASLTLGSRWIDERLDVGVRGIYNGRRPEMTFVGSGRVNVRWSPHTVWNLYGSYAVSDALSVDVNIDNVGDKYYADPLLIGITAAPGRTVRFGVTYTF